ncbi:MAG: Fe-S cluster assembly protein SufD [Cyclobacteriaceae bacterium]
MSTLTGNSLPEILISEIEKLKPSESRKAATAHLYSSGLPGKKNEEYRYIQISDLLRKILQKDSEINRMPDEKVASERPFVLPDSAGITFINGCLSPDFELPAGVSIVQFESEKQKDPFGILNDIFSENPLALEVAATCGKVLHIHHHSISGLKSTLAFPAIQLHLKQGVECSIVETFSHEGAGHHFSAPTLHVTVEANAVCHYIRLQQCSGNWSQVYNSLIRQKENSTVHAFVLTTDGEIVRNNFNLEIDGAGAEGNLMGLYLLNGKTVVDNHTTVDHRVANANSNELFKGVMHGSSKGVFNGKIFVRQDAQKTNAFQSNRNIILSDSASVNTKPQLEIWADDVKCSHGCTTGQLDEEALFYLQSRGIDKTEAQAMLLDAFAGEVTDKITSGTIRNIVSEIVRQKIASLK